MPTDALTPRQARFVAAWCAHPLLVDAADAAGVSIASAKRYARHPTVLAAFRGEAHAVGADALTGVAGLAPAALDALRRNLRCGVPGVEVRAAVAVLDVLTRADDVLALAERVADLEQA